MVTTLARPHARAARFYKRWPLGTHYVDVTSLEEWRLFGTSNEEARRSKSAVFYQGIEARQRLPQGMHDRCEEHVFAAGNPTALDLRGLAQHLPLRYKVIRLDSHRVRAEEVWDLTLSHEHWPELDYLEEVFVFLQVDHLFLEENARIIIQGNVLAVECGTLERTPAKRCSAPVSADLYDFGILPTQFSVDRTTNPNTGAHGQDGLPGAHGGPGASVRVAGSLFGPCLTDPADGSVLRAEPDGRDGRDGGHGTSGCRGRNGGMCRLADIRIERLVGFEDNPLRIFSQAGTGKPGGNGGSGGDGGNGGDGADFVEAMNGLIPAGSGGNGGHAGNGGDGGQGGNGGIASNIFLQLRARDCPQVQTLSLPSTGGAGGAGGIGGKAGLGGRGGNGEGALGNEEPGQDGSMGRAGKGGCSGNAGKGRPGARIFVIPAS